MLLDVYIFARKPINYNDVLSVIGKNKAVVDTKKLQTLLCKAVIATETWTMTKIKDQIQTFNKKLLMYEKKLFSYFKKKMEFSFFNYLEKRTKLLQLIFVKGKYGVASINCVDNYGFYLFKKFFYKFLRGLKTLNTLSYNLVGVVGRGMSLAVWKRYFLRDGLSKIKKQVIKNARNVFFKNSFSIMKKKRITIKKKKKKVYTKQVYDFNKLFRKKNLTNYALTRLGERGHVSYKIARKFVFKYRKKNPLYKVLAFVTTAFRKRELLFMTNRVLQHKPFGPYKVKGLKKLGETGVIKEGKTRKL